jgi:(p)ppGpp synthase/HD superfamily hydrolase
MKLTDENQDDMDCRPLNPNTGIATRRSRWSRLSAAIAFALAGMLHDAIEDQGQRQEAAITERFGARVARIVRACTDADTMPKPPWRARKEAYVRHLEDANADVLLVSAADKLHNARAILTDLRTHGLAVFERFTGRIDGTLWYYEALAEVFGRRLPGALASELLESTKAVRRATEALRSGAPR